MAWPMTLLALTVLIALGGPASAAPGDLCGQLFVPEGYRLTCSLEGGRGQQARGLLTVEPAEGAFAGLSELTIRPVEEPVADPAKWLRDQLTLDISSFDAALDELLNSPDSPVADSQYSPGASGSGSSSSGGVQSTAASLPPSCSPASW